MKSQVDGDYAHHSKHATPGGLILTSTAELKLYHVAKRDAPVPARVADLARQWIETQAGEALGTDGDRGLVILHRCGADFFFLLTVLWRGNNEAWEAVWYLQGDMAAFAPFDPAYAVDPGGTRPTFCVWELGVLAHEATAWARFLGSPRGEADAARWRESWFEGSV